MRFRNPTMPPNDADFASPCEPGEAARREYLWWITLPFKALLGRKNVTQVNNLPFFVSFENRMTLVHALKAECFPSVTPKMSSWIHLSCSGWASSVALLSGGHGSDVTRPVKLLNRAERKESSVFGGYLANLKHPGLACPYLRRGRPPFILDLRQLEVEDSSFLL